MRKVKFTLSDISGGPHNREGFFHQWGTISERSGPDTLAIVEDALTGQCHYLYAYQFHFTDRPEVGEVAVTRQ